jgi:hypothetical protein
LPFSTGLIIFSHTKNAGGFPDNLEGRGAEPAVIGFCKKALWKILTFFPYHVKPKNWIETKKIR